MFIGFCCDANVYRLFWVEGDSTEGIGTWTHPAGADLEFSGDGRFVARSVPASLLFGSALPAQFVSGQGTWQLSKGDTGWRVNLQFDPMPEKPSGFETPVLTSGVGKSLSLFFWKGEEGGERYQFSRVR